MLFHLIWNTENAWVNGEQSVLSEEVLVRIRRTISSILKQERDAVIWLWSDTLPLEYLQIISTSSQLQLKRIDYEELIVQTPIALWRPTNQQFKEELNAVVNYSDLVRLLVLYRYGGMYLDASDTLLLKPITELGVANAVGWEHQGTLSNGAMLFESKHSFLTHCLENYGNDYRPELWGHQGPALITRTLRKLAYLVSVDVPCCVFCPVAWHAANVLYLGDVIDAQLRASLIQQIETNTFVLHYFHKSNGEKAIEEGSVLRYFIDAYS